MVERSQTNKLELDSHSERFASEAFFLNDIKFFSLSVNFLSFLKEVGCVNLKEQVNNICKRK